MNKQRQNNAKENFCIDIDGVLADSRRALAEYCAQELRIKVSKESLEKFKLHQLLGIQKDKSRRLIDHFYKTRQESFDVIEGSQEALMHLSNSYNLYIVSGRPEYSECLTRKWVNIKYPGLITDVLFAQAHDIRTPRNRLTKGKICEFLDSRFMVDDDSTYSYDCLNSGITVLYINGDKPITREHLITVASWKEILRYAIGGSNSN